MLGLPENAQETAYAVAAVFQNDRLVAKKQYGL